MIPFFDKYRGLAKSLAAWAGSSKHLRADHARNDFSSRAMRGNHIKGIKGFWGYAKTRPTRFRGMRPSAFYLHLKDCEFRFNHRRDSL